MHYGATTGTSTGTTCRRLKRAPLGSPGSPSCLSTSQECPAARPTLTRTERAGHGITLENPTAIERVRGPWLHCKGRSSGKRPPGSRRPSRRRQRACGCQIPWRFGGPRAAHSIMNVDSGAAREHRPSSKLVRLELWDGSQSAAAAVGGTGPARTGIETVSISSPTSPRAPNNRAWDLSEGTRGEPSTSTNERKGRLR